MTSWSELGSAWQRLSFVESLRAEPETPGKAGTRVPGTARRRRAARTRRPADGSGGKMMKKMHKFQEHHYIKQSIHPCNNKIFQALLNEFLNDIMHLMYVNYLHYAINVCTLCINSLHFFSRRDRLHEETKRKVLVFFFFWRGKSSWINHGHIDIDTNFWSNRIKLYSRFEVFAFILSIYDLLLISDVLPLRFLVLSAISRNVESIFETIWIGST